MGIGMAADLMALPDRAGEQRALRDRILADDEEGRRNMPRLENVEDLRRPSRIGAVVEGQRNQARAISVPSNRVGPRYAQKVDVREQAVGAVGNLTEPRRRKRGDPEDFPAA